ncbi:MAG: SPOR domain-containing protein [Rhodothermales bacterium]
MIINALAKKTGYICLFIICLAIVFLLGGVSHVIAQAHQIADNRLSESINEIQPGEYTWVTFSSTSYQQALVQQLGFREQGFTGDIIKAAVDGQTYYRVIFGQYGSRKEANAAKKTLRVFLPFDAWLLVLKADFELLSRAEWLPATSVKEALEKEGQMVAQKDGDQQDAQEITQVEELKLSEETDAPPDDVEPDAVLNSDVEEEGLENTSTGVSFDSFLRQHVSAELQFANIYEDNIDHDEDFEAVQSYGMVPALQVQFRSSATDPLITLEYLVARHAYSNTERWDRVSNSFRGALEPRISDALHAKTSVELSLKGSSEDRDVSNQFQIVQEVEYRFSRRHRLQVYGTYRVKRFPDQPGAKDFKPNVGINFERSNSDGERFESGARYEFNKEEELRGNYKRWTFTVDYRTPEILNKNQFEVGVKHRRKSYTARFVEIEDEDYLRLDNRLSVGLSWSRDFSRGVSMEVAYEFETRGSNDPEKLYEANALSLIMTYAL